VDVGTVPDVAMPPVDPGPGIAGADSGLGGHTAPGAPAETLLPEGFVSVVAAELGERVGLMPTAGSFQNPGALGVFIG
jgi:hypothetical protein